MASAPVLVVDDEPDIRQTVKEILEDEGYVVDWRRMRPRQRARRGARSVPTWCCSISGCPDLDGISLLREWAERGGCLPGDHDVGPRHGRNRGRSDAARRVGFHRKTHFAGQAAADDRARARSQPTQARERRTAPAAGAAAGVRSAASKAMQALRAQLEKLGAARHLGADPGRARHRQGNARALAARRRRAAHRAVRAGRAGSIPREHLVGALFGAENADRRAAGTARTGQWRHAVSRRSRRTRCRTAAAAVQRAAAAQHWCAAADAGRRRSICA